MAIKMVHPKAKPTSIQLLTTEQKQFIVKACARYISAPDIVKQVQDEFGITIGQNLVARYDPERSMGKTLSPPLRDLFYSTRRAFSEELETVPGMIRATRIQRLDDIFHKAMAKGDLRSAVAAMTSLRKEMEAFTVEDDEQDNEPWPAA